MALAVAAYMFFATPLLYRFFESVQRAIPSTLWIVDAIFGILPMFVCSIALAPLCVIAVLRDVPLRRLLLYYIALIYIGLLGDAILNGKQLAFDAPPGLQVPWSAQAINSPVFLVIGAFFNAAPTIFVWGLSKALFWRKGVIAHGEVDAQASDSRANCLAPRSDAADRRGIAECERPEAQKGSLPF